MDHPDKEDPMTRKSASRIAPLIVLLGVLPALAARGQDTAPQAAAKRPVGLSSLTPLSAWVKIAPGVWKASAGDMSREIRYTDYAAEKVRTLCL